MGSFMRKVVISGIVAAVAVLGGAGAALAGSASSGTAAGPAGTGPAAAQRLLIRSVAGHPGASAIERLIASGPLATAAAPMFLGAGLSCASPTACLNVGLEFIKSGNSGKIVPAAQRLHAGRWKSVTVKAPKGADETVLEGVSCKAATYCLVIGDSVGGGLFVVGTAPLSSSSSANGDSPLVMSWNGTALTPLAAPPVPKADELSGLTGVSCVAVKSCVVIGSGDVLATGDTVQFVWTLSGTKWKVTAITEPGTAADNFPPTGPGPSPAPSPTQSTGPATSPSPSSSFDGLRCFSLRSCVAVGESVTITGSASDEVFTSTPLAGYWNGKTFASLKAPAPSGTADGTLTGVSCVTTRACAVVGVATNASGSAGLGFAEVWNGKSWAVTKWGGSKGDIDAELLGVSCTSAVRCMAVGEHGTDTTVGPAALAWGGSKWKLLKVPGAGKGKAAVFTAVSCPVNGKCVATGETGKTSTSAPALLPLAGYWNGSAWKYGPMFAAA
jgi:hypothetical protein